jgi:hypothetical protein
MGLSARHRRLEPSPATRAEDWGRWDCFHRLVRRGATVVSILPVLQAESWQAVTTPLWNPITKEFVGRGFSAGNSGGAFADRASRMSPRPRPAGLDTPTDPGPAEVPDPRQRVTRPALLTASPLVQPDNTRHDRQRRQKRQPSQAGPPPGKAVNIRPCSVSGVRLIQNP